MAEPTPQQQSAIERALANPGLARSKRILEKAQAAGFVDNDDISAAAGRKGIDAEEPSLAEKVGRFGMGFTQGAAEMVNLPAIPGGLERLGRAGAKIVGGERKPDESLFGKIGRSFAEASKEAVLPMPTVGETAAGVRTAIRKPFNIGTPTKELFGEEMKAQEEFRQQMSSPTGETVGAVATAVPGVIQIGKAIMRGAGAAKRLGQAGMQTFKKTVEGADDLKGALKEVLQKSDGEIVEAIIKRPEEVRKALIENRLSVDDLSKTLRVTLGNIRKGLGEQVGKFRSQITASDDDIISTKPFRAMLEKLDNSFRQKTRGGVTGQSALSRKELSEIDEISNLLQAEKISPRETLQIVDKLEGLADPARAASGRVSNGYSFAIRDLRRQIKNKLRGLSKELDGWAEADEAFVNYNQAAGQIERRLDSMGRTSFVNNLLNKNKEPVVEALEQALDFAGSAKVADKSSGLLNIKQRFFEELANIKAAQGLKARELGIGDPIADNIARIIAKYETRGKTIGGLAGMAAGGASGSPFGGIGGVGGSVSGGMAGRLIGGSIGRRIGERMADPMRILDLAIKGKKSSAGVKELAQDLRPVAKALGRDGVIAVLTSIGPIQEVNELVELAEGQ